MALSSQEKQVLSDQIAKADAQIPIIEAEINRARLAGLDVADYTSRLTALKNQVRLLKQHYYGK